ncbi:DUF1232 domain-containing protein [Kineosporia rhizophila]|uniref:YkvA family protein n=1 Tax=Kineosporia rhizophila TaxID=84633 RepID=UPI000ACAA100|nr:YkvA family protein [Kineosporia rhizophila]MCE0539058.1 DUF1232 domain-containing protein [Kineosporia rhizophila]
MGDNTTLMVVVGFVAVLLLVAVTLLAVGLFVIYRYRVPLHGIATMAASFAYLISPVDAVPEAVVGPFGILDDAGVVTLAAWYVYHLIRARRTNMPIRKAAGIALRDTAQQEFRRKNELRRPDRDLKG